MSSSHSTILAPEDLGALTAELGEFVASFGISNREAEVLRLLLSGVTAARPMARLLKISPHTVNNHLRRIYERTGTTNKTEIAAAFVRFVLGKLNHCKLLTKQPKILVLDDEPEIGAMVADFLRAKGLKVLVETDPRRALETARERELDFVVSDIDMPGMSGLALLKELRQIHRRLPMVILITGKSAYSIEQSLDLGAVSFIPKPLNLGQLFFTIMERFIETPEGQPHPLGRKGRLAVTLPGLRDIAAADLGFGGIFLPLPEASDAPERRGKVGDRVAFEFRLGDHGTPRKAEGEVVWRRDMPAAHLRPGLGIKFVRLDDAAREAVDDFVRAHRISSFIPLGLVRSYEGETQAAEAPKAS